MKCAYWICTDDYRLYKCQNETLSRDELLRPVCQPCSFDKNATNTKNLTFNKFSELNRKRCEAPSPQGFNESLAPGSAYGPEHWALATGEEAGEVLGAVLGMTGRKARKKDLTKQDVFKEIGDTAACLDLLAQSLGSTLGECVQNKFNEVSDRIGSNIKL
jgi:NTP pyrophosphatase (non-canonical NTP hydrolase)